jgi:carbonic anhydrase
MCEESWSVNRRKFLVAAGASTLSAVVSQAAAGASKPVSDEAKSALARLKEGNRRFAEGKTRHAHQTTDWRRHLVGAQRPIATLLGCSDSRVPPEMVFDEGLGDLFVIRVAGNVVAPDVVGSLAYALEHLKTPLVVVLGHQNCGAVTAAVDALSDPAFRDIAPIRGLVDLIEPGLKTVDLRSPPEKRVAAAVEANVRWSVRQLAEQPSCKKLLADEAGLLTGGVYELSTGLVRFLDG